MLRALFDTSSYSMFVSLTSEVMRFSHCSCVWPGQAPSIETTTARFIESVTVESWNSNQGTKLNNTIIKHNQTIYCFCSSIWRSSLLFPPKNLSMSFHASSMSTFLKSSPQNLKYWPKASGILPWWHSVTAREFQGIQPVLSWGELWDVHFKQATTIF